MPLSTVHLICKIYSEQGNFTGKIGSGRRKSLYSKDLNKLSKIVRKNSDLSSEEIRKSFNKDATSKPVRNLFKTINIFSMSPNMKLFLNGMHKEIRLRWGMKNLGRSEDFWERVIWGSAFSLFGSDGCKRR